MERIFLLEDDEALGRGVAMALAGPDREVSRAASLAEAKAALTGQRFSLLVLDVKNAAYFQAGGAPSQHGGGNLFARDPDIMGWLFQH